MTVGDRLDEPFRRWLRPDEHVVAVVDIRSLPMDRSVHDVLVTQAEAAFLDVRGNRLLRGFGTGPVSGPEQATTLAVTQERLLVIVRRAGEPDQVVANGLASVARDAAWTPGPSIEGQEFERRRGALDVVLRAGDGTWVFTLTDIERRHAESFAVWLRTRLRWATTSSGDQPGPERFAEDLGYVLVATLFAWIAAVVSAVALGGAVTGLAGTWFVPAIALAPLAAFVLDWIARRLRALRDPGKPAESRRARSRVGRTVIWAALWTVAFGLGATALR